MEIIDGVPYRIHGDLLEKHNEKKNKFTFFDWRQDFGGKKNGIYCQQNCVNFSTSPNNNRWSYSIQRVSKKKKIKYSDLKISKFRR